MLLFINKYSSQQRILSFCFCLKNLIFLLQFIEIMQSPRPFQQPRLAALLANDPMSCTLTWKTFKESGY
jgi:hypothetical protein